MDLFASVALLLSLCHSYIIVVDIFGSNVYILTLENLYCISIFLENLYCISIFLENLYCISIFLFLSTVSHFSSNCIAYQILKVTFFSCFYFLFLIFLIKKTVWIFEFRTDKGYNIFFSQFFLELMQVPRAESKLRVFSFKIQFSSQVHRLTCHRRTYTNIHGDNLLNNQLIQ